MAAPRRECDLRINMVEGYYHQIVKLIKKMGFNKIKGGKGSHEKWNNGEFTLIVPRHMQSKHTANSILKQSGSDHRL